VSQRLNVCAVQLTSTDDWQSNQSFILQKIKEVKSFAQSTGCDSTDLISFPENSLYFKLHENSPKPAIELSDALFDPILEQAQKYNCLIHLGSVPILENGQIWNATVLLYPNGDRKLAYKKMHLFDVEIGGDRAYRESDTFAHGHSPAIVEWRGWRFGLSICYDLRFGELYSAYGRAGVDALLVPSAFTVPTGRAHWEVLLRARAIECQAYVIAAAQGGEHGPKRQTWGHTMIVEPWGEHSQVDTGGGLLLHKLDKERLKLMREQIPMKNHRHSMAEFETSIDVI